MLSRKEELAAAKQGTGDEGRKGSKCHRADEPRMRAEEGDQREGQPNQLLRERIERQ